MDLTKLHPLATRVIVGLIHQIMVWTIVKIAPLILGVPQECLTVVHLIQMQNQIQRPKMIVFVIVDILGMDPKVEPAHVLCVGVVFIALEATITL